MTNPIREMIRSHQEATDTSDGEILNILCAYLGAGMYPNIGGLEDYIVDHLQQLPGGLQLGAVDHTPAWQLPMFTDEDRDTIVHLVMDELSDESVKDRAHDFLEDLCLVETIGYAAPGEIDELVDMLDHIGPTEDQVSGQFLREQGEPEDDYPVLLDFAKRMGLINEDETEVTALGREFMQEHS